MAGRFLKAFEQHQMFIKQPRKHKSVYALPKDIFSLKYTTNRNDTHVNFNKTDTSPAFL